jgi:hypothetical protein
MLYALPNLPLPASGRHYRVRSVSEHFDPLRG